MVRSPRQTFARLPGGFGAKIAFLEDMSNGQRARPLQEAFKATVCTRCSAEPGCSNCIKTRLRCRRLPHLMPLALMRKRVVPAAG
jgi:hypothetical protein